MKKGGNTATKKTHLQKGGDRGEATLSSSLNCQEGYGDYLEKKNPFDTVTKHVKNF